jgi:hypothetical protein
VSKGPQSASEWAVFYAEQRDRAQAQAVAQQARQPKPKPGANDPHPLLAPPRFQPGTPPEVVMHFIDSYRYHERAAQEAVNRHRESAGREHERRNAPHPQAHGPLAAIPMPVRREPRHRSR